MNTVIESTKNWTVLKKRLSSKERKYQLTSIAMEVFATQGIGGASHADIAEIAHVSVATVFNYFPTRLDLVSFVLNHASHQLSLFFVEHINPQSNIQDNLLKIIDEIMLLTRENSHWLTIWFEGSTSVQKEMHSLFLSFNQVNQQTIERMFNQAIERNELNKAYDATTLTLLLHSICYTLLVQTYHTQTHRIEKYPHIHLLTKAYLTMIFITDDASIEGA